MNSKYFKLNEIDGVWTFLKSVDWSEKWLQGLICFHLGCLILTYSLCKYHNIQAIYFAILLSIVYFAENINKYGAIYWKNFSNHQYFDSNGVFISLVLSAPILINCLLIICNWLWNASLLLNNIRNNRSKLISKQLKKENDMAKDKKLS
ncbi:unnamed protein product [Gordionus sp. m RMFG-2023]